MIGSARRVTRATLFAVALVLLLVVAWSLPAASVARSGSREVVSAPAAPATTASVRDAALAPAPIGGSMAKPLPTSSPPSPTDALPSTVTGAGPGRLHQPNFRLGGAVPQSWGSATPPGWEYPLQSLARAHGPAPTPQNGLPGSYQQWIDNWCNGIWPDSGGQSAYQSDCYGHDEPGMQFYSNLPGSGGNVSWKVTLPVSRGPTTNQSDLYSAIWFGMTLTVPSNAWMNQCFLELQFYPDSSWYAPGPLDLADTVYGQWVGAAVAWQIQSSTGFENPCFYEPLYLNGHPGAAFLNMSQGDAISVTMTGWAGDTAGEQLAIVDSTNGESSTFNLYNQSCATAPSGSVPACGGDYPLDPSYATNSYENGLQWTPGGEYPVVYAYEIGHAGNPAFPNNNVFGGCNPGYPNASYGGTPCPSYDPGSWANDTLSPWQFSVPTFFNAQATQTPAQVAFTDPQGGLDITYGGNVFGGFPWAGACDGAVGSAFCSYPWYSYYCGSHTFEFGAMDYPGVSDDFGQYYQYQTYPEANGAGWLYYPPTNYSIPTCGGPSYAVTVGPQSAGAGAAYFLSNAYYANQNVSGLAPGVYSINALPFAGSAFRGWITGGGASVADAASPSTTLDVEGNGFAVAEFGSTPAVNVTVTWAMSGAGTAGTIELGNGSLFNGATILAGLTDGATTVLAPGTYGVEAYPPMGYNFTGWSVTGSGTIAAAGFPWTELDVSGASSAVTVTANFAASWQPTSAVIIGAGDGTVTFNGSTVPYYSVFQESFGYFFGPVGSYVATATPAPGWSFGGWLYGSSIVMNGFFNEVTAVNIEQSTGGIYGPTTELEAVFNPLPPPPATVQLLAAPSGAGAISFAGAAPATSATFTVPTGTYSLYADPAAGQVLTGWAGAPAANVSFSSTVGGLTTATISGNVTIYANFTAGVPETVGFVTWPRAGGAIDFNFETYSGVAYNSSVAIGSYLVEALPAPGSAFVGFETFGPVFVSGNEAFVYGNNSYIDAIFQALPPPSATLFPVTFIATTPGAVVATFAQGSISSGGTTVSSGETVWLPEGTSVVQAYGPNQLPAVAWVATAAIVVDDPGSYLTTIEVYGPGTIYATLSGLIGPTTVSAPIVDAGTPVSFATSITSFVGGSTSVTWNGLPAGCTSTALVFTCAPAATGTFNVTATATFADGVTATSNVATITVTVLPDVTVTIAPHAIDLGGVALIDIAGAGGSGALALAVTGLPTGCLVATFGAISCLPAATGAFTVTATVTDALGLRATATAPLTVNEPLRVGSVAASSPEVTAGTMETLSTVVSGGTAPYTYSYVGLPAGCTASPNGTDSCAATAAGTYTVTVLVTDAGGGSSTGSTTFVVNPAPTIIAFTVSDPTVATGGTVVFAVDVLGGTTPWTYSYAGVPAGCTAGAGASFACSPNAQGTYTVTVTVTDADRATASAQVTLTVAPPTTTTGTSTSSDAMLEALAVAALVVGLLALAVAVLVGMRARGPGGGASAPSPPKSWREDDTESKGTTGGGPGK